MLRCAQAKKLKIKHFWKNRTDFKKKMQWKGTNKKYYFYRNKYVDACPKYIQSFIVFGVYADSTSISFFLKRGSVFAYFIQEKTRKTLY